MSAFEYPSASRNKLMVPMTLPRLTGNVEHRLAFQRQDKDQHLRKLSQMD